MCEIKIWATLIYQQSINKFPSTRWLQPVAPQHAWCVKMNEQHSKNYCHSSDTMVPINFHEPAGALPDSLQCCFVDNCFIIISNLHQSEKMLIQQWCRFLAHAVFVNINRLIQLQPHQQNQGSIESFHLHFINHGNPQIQSWKSTFTYLP
ncbi:Hypothetical_protein [Hexamita inflata]|uniref:Hypothetical_protein n=1 Tax=Hexamita inflata TaxID=28002 RepID=A0AA86U320_9EUKA|nr:Hypothetical protein HINF_LOCUS16863 [Hexamita inflata]